MIQQLTSNGFQSNHIVNNLFPETIFHVYNFILILQKAIETVQTQPKLQIADITKCLTTPVMGFTKPISPVLL